MTREELNAYCKSLPATTHVVQWGNSDVWKVGGKVFAVIGWYDKGESAISFKVTPLAFEILGEQPGCRPAPYLASRGMKWIQWFSDESISNDDLRGYIEQSHTLVASGLTKKKRAELGLAEK